MTAVSKLPALLSEAKVAVHICAAGAGYDLIRSLTERPGASAFLSGASFPYAPRETDALLGYTPKSYVSRETALELAMMAYQRASAAGSRALGIGITAALTSGRKHRGGERAFVSVVSEARSVQGHVGWENIPRSEQDPDVSSLVGLLLEEALAAESWDPESDERVEREARALLLARPYWQFDGQRLPPPERPGALLSGAFNPVHEQHFAMKTEVEQRFGEPVTFHLELTAPHKPALRTQDVLRRLAGLRHHTTLLTSGLPLYLDRARAFPDTPIILGTDALDRMLDPKWGPPIHPMLVEFAQQGTRFYVSARVIDGKRVSLTDVLTARGVDPDLDLFFELDCYSELSSTALRQAAGA